MLMGSAVSIILIVPFAESAEGSGGRRWNLRDEPSHFA